MRLSYLLTTVALVIGPALAAPLAFTPKSLIARSIPSTRGSGSNGAVMINKRTTDPETEAFERRDWSGVGALQKRAPMKMIPSGRSSGGSIKFGSTTRSQGSSLGRLGTTRRTTSIFDKIKNRFNSTRKGPTTRTKGRKNTSGNRPVVKDVAKEQAQQFMETQLGAQGAVIPQ
ncbi:hypothetical protein M408DRAFT_329373 [Serendipita vermifera MAFF 305830]|uniref:Uncharacterized protein n=1 Tax=Serendipita vermifera MAFF 305830 TaxID=933852 RepID=A0A0C3BB12_SERVB|nr:hypothetical protein M408DRAFT_329373 [Serendipita vermifera MAFF 305830]